MTVLVQGPEKNYPAGQDRSISFAIPLGATRIKALATRVNWPDTGEPVIEAMMEISYDGGLTFPGRAGFTSYGGQSIINGVPVNESSIDCPLSEPDNPNRRVLIAVTTTVALRSAVRLEVVP